MYDHGAPATRRNVQHEFTRIDYKVPLLDVGGVISRGCRKSKGYTPVTHSWRMLGQKGVLLLY